MINEIEIYYANDFDKSSTRVGTKTTFLTFGENKMCKILTLFLERFSEKIFMRSFCENFHFTNKSV
jgi:hypothetical protein